MAILLGVMVLGLELQNDYLLALAFTFGSGQDFGSRNSRFANGNFITVRDKQDLIYLDFVSLGRQ
jgi:hypothetical protein